MSTSLHDKEFNSLADILSSTLRQVPPSASLYDAIKLMQQYQSSAVIVVDDNYPLGILTERDVVRLAYEKVNPDDFLVSQKMSSPLITAATIMDYRDAYQLLIEHEIRHLVILEPDGRMAGVVSESEIRKHLGFEYFAGLNPIVDIMTADVMTLTPEDAVANAVALMCELKIDCVVVQVDNRPEGILTERDIVVLIQRREDLSSLLLRDVMNSPVHTYPKRNSVTQASEMMNNLGVRRLVVTECDGRIAGVVNQQDILKGLRVKVFDFYNEIIFQQASELQSVEQRLNQKGVVLENILQSITDLAIIAADPDGYIVYRNSALADLFPFDKNEVARMTLGDMLRWGNLENSESDNYLTRAREEGVAEFVMQITRFGTPSHLEVRITEMRDAQKNSVGYVMVIKDISTRKQADEQLRKLSRVIWISSSKCSRKQVFPMRRSALKSPKPPRFPTFRMRPGLLNSSNLWAAGFHWTISAVVCLRSPTLRICRSII